MSQRGKQNNGSKKKPAKPAEPAEPAMTSKPDQSKSRTQERNFNPGNSISSGSRHFFDKITRDDQVPELDAYNSRRFVKCMDDFENKADLLQRLVKKDTRGLQRIREAISSGNDEDHFSSVTGRILDLFSTGDWQRPILRETMSQALMYVWYTPGLLDLLTKLALDTSSTLSTKETICRYLSIIVSCHLGARRESEVYQIAFSFYELAIPNSLELLGMLGSHSHDTGLQRNRSSTSDDDASKIVRPGWIPNSDPGQLNDNNPADFREIKILPTENELYAPQPTLPSQMRFIARPVDDLSRFADMEYALNLQFRLLREDMVAPMRDELKSRQNNSSSSKKCLENVNVVGVECEKRMGGTACVTISFTNKPKWNADFWQETSRNFFSNGSMVCLKNISSNDPESIDLIDDDDNNMNGTNALFGVIANRDDAAKGTIGIDFGGSTSKAIDLIGALPKEYELIMVSNSFFSFRPILVALQHMNRIPFPEEFLYGTSVPLELDNDPYTFNYLPARVTLPSDICKNGKSVYMQRGPDFEVGALEAQTDLDSSQVQALHRALTDRVSLIQGPPGTGKTFIGSIIARTILSNAANGTKLLCLCYTNHALDQFLEHLLEKGIKRIVRVGGRSTNTKLEAYNINILTRNENYYGADSQRHFDLKNQHLNSLEYINTLKYQLESDLEWDEIHDFGNRVGMFDHEYGNDDDFNVLGVRYQDLISAFEVFEDPDGFQQPKGNEVKASTLLKTWLDGNSPPRGHRDRLRNPVWHIEVLERQIFFTRLKHLIRDHIREKLTAALNVHNDLIAKVEELKQRQQIRVMNQAQVVGMTTTRASSSRALLEELNPKVVIIEEAGEVLEAHVLTSVSRTARHLVLIGDHKQLRPKVDTYKLTVESGEDHNLNCSLFERLITSNNQLRHSMLEIQHRMRPEISNLIRSCTYPGLKDHQSVLDRPPILGLDNSKVVFISHRELEEGLKKEGNKVTLDITARNAGAPQSKINLFEVGMVVEIVGFLLLQGYQPSQLVVLTPYLGQMRELRRALSKGSIGVLISDMDRLDLEKPELIETDNDDCTDDYPILRKTIENKTDKQVPDSSKGVRVATVDNYQGEESDIVVASLVRSNSEGSIGFLQEPERANVLLSRARFGLIMIGNDETLRECKSKKGRLLWEQVLNLLEKSNSIVSGLPALCQNHPDDGPVLLNTPQSFREKFPDGGCTRPCNSRLDCGHACTLCCHPRNCSLVSKCHQPCAKAPCPRAHPCEKMCYEPCGACPTLVDGVHLPCGHVANRVPCYQSDNPKDIKCRSMIMYEFPDCRHRDAARCSLVTEGKATCTITCNAVLKCGHKCSRACGICNLEKSHTKCDFSCERSLVCGHICGAGCHDPAPCPPCKNRCQMKCQHSSCSKQCAMVCSACTQSCTWICIHQGLCKLPCGAPCSRLPCDKRCYKVLECGHQCPGLCGEPCPSAKKWCLKCDPNNSNSSSIVDLIMGQVYNEVNLDEPLQAIIPLPCGHAYTVETLDGHLELMRGYNYNQEYKVFDSIKALEGDWVLKQCPSCKSPIHGIMRYGRVQRAAELKALERKFILLCQSSLLKIKKIDQRLLKFHVPDKKELNSLLEQYINQLNSVRKKNPTRKVYEACRHMNTVQVQVEISNTEVPLPVTAPLLDILMAFGGFCIRLNSIEYKDTVRLEARSMLEEAIEISDKDGNARVGGQARLLLTRLCIACANHGYGSIVELKDEAYALLDWVLNHPAAPVKALVNEAKELLGNVKKVGQLTAEELRDIIAEVNRAEGSAMYPNGWNGAGHWFVCPQNHPYFIGECGGAMQETTCPECGARVGGQSHALAPGNSQWSLATR